LLQSLTFQNQYQREFYRKWRGISIGEKNSNSNNKTQGVIFREDKKNFFQKFG